MYSLRRTTEQITECNLFVRSFCWSMQSATSPRVSERGTFHSITFHVHTESTEIIFPPSFRMEIFEFRTVARLMYPKIHARLKIEYASFRK